MVILTSDETTKTTRRKKKKMSLPAKVTKLGKIHTNLMKCSDSIFVKISRTVCSTQSPYVPQPALKKLFTHYQDIKLSPYCLKHCGFGDSFSETNVNVLPYCMDGNNNIVNPYHVDYEHSTKLHTFCVGLMPLFSDGMKQVSSIISEQQHPSTVDQNLLQAVKTLDMFLENREFHEQCLFHLAGNDIDSYKELDIAVMLVNHLFLPLVSFNPGDRINGVVNNDSKDKVSSCPCAKNCDTQIVYGDTRFGSGCLWYGRSDITLFPLGGGKMNITVKDAVDADTLNFEELASNYRQNMEENCNVNQLRNKTNARQVTAQAITFSFYQNKYQSEKRDKCRITTLIPTIITSRHYFDIYFYDSENDVLLRNLDGPRPIFIQSPADSSCFLPKFDLNSVLQFWMLINHLLLHPRLTDNHLKILNETCGVKKEIEASNLMDKVRSTLDTASSFKPLELQTGYSVHEISP